MRKLFFMILLLLPVLAWAQSPFDGTWMGDLKGSIVNQDIQMPLTILEQNGTFQYSDINVKADGTDQPTPKSQAFDAVAVKVVDDKTVEVVGKKGGKVVELIKFISSPDSKMSTVEVTLHFDDSKPQATQTMTFIRIAAGPSGAHPVSGTWKPQTYIESHAVTYKSSPDGLIMSAPDGKSFDAKFDGKDYPIKGGIAGMTVSLAKVNDHTIIETDKVGEKIIEVSTMTVSADGKTLTVKSESKELGRTTMFKGIKE
jgi:hypothetical protein